MSATSMGMTVHLSRIVGDEVRTYAVSPLNSRTGSACDGSTYEWDDDAAAELVVSYFWNGGRLDEADAVLRERIALRRCSRLSSALATCQR